MSRIRRRQRPMMPVTPQQKAIAVNDKFGNKGIAKQQGTTRQIYDTLPLDGRTTYQFFQEANTRQFPLSNVGALGRMEVGETLVIEAAYITQLTYTTTITAFTAVTLGTAPVVGGELSFSIANNTVLKPTPMLSFIDQYNSASQFQLQSVFEFGTQLVILPMVEFVATLRMAAGLTVVNDYLRFTLTGVGSILAPRNTF